RGGARIDVVRAARTAREHEITDSQGPLPENSSEGLAIRIDRIGAAIADGRFTPAILVGMAEGVVQFVAQLVQVIPQRTARIDVVAPLEELHEMVLVVRSPEQPRAQARAEGRAAHTGPGGEVLLDSIERDGSPRGQYVSHSCLLE